MAYIDYLRQYHDDPRFGVGGFSLSGLVNAVKNFFTPQKQQSKPAPQQSRPAQSTSNPWSNPAPSYARPSTPAPQVSRPSYSAPSVTQSRPQVSYSKPTVTQSNPWQNPQPSYVNPSIALKSYPTTTSMGAVSKVITQSPFSQQLKQQLLSTSTPNNTAQQFGTSLMGKAGKAMTAIGTALHAPQLVEGGLGSLMQSAAGNVMAAESTKKPLTYAFESSQAGPKSYGNPFGTPSSSWIDSGRNMNNLRQETINPGVTANDANKSATDTQSYVDDANKFTKDIYALLTDPNVEKQMNDTADTLWNDVVNGNLAYEDYQRKVAEEQRKILANQYAALKADAEAKIPDIQKQIEGLIGSENEGLTRFKDTINQSRSQKEITYDEMLKRAVKNQKLNEGNLRNVFTNLGTAESSAFIDKLTGLLGEGQQENAGIERNKAIDLGNLDKTLQNETIDTNKRISNIQDQGKSSLDEIRRYITNLGGEEANAISTLMSNLYNALATGQQKLVDAKTGLTTAKYNQAANLQDAVTNYGLQSNLLKQQYDAMNGVSGQDVMGGKYARPQGFSSTLWDKASQLYNSGLRGTELVKQLKRMGIGDAQDWMYNFLLDPVNYGG